MRTNSLLDPKWIKTQPFLEPKLRTDLGRTTDKNSLFICRLIKPAYKIAKSVTETSSNVQKPKIYKEAMDNLIHEN